MRACDRRSVARFLRALVLTGVACATVAACSGAVSQDEVRSSETVITGLTVSGEPDRAPTVRMRTPLEVDQTTTAVTITGTGAPIQVDQLFVLELTLYDARTGKLALSTYDTGTAVAAKSTDDRLFPALSAALVGVRQGSRLVLAATAQDAYATGGTPPKGVERDDPVVVVADVVAVPPAQVLEKVDGTKVPHVPAAPALVLTNDVVTGLDLAGVDWSATPRAYPQLLGDGPAARAHSVVTVDYVAQRRGQADPFEDTYFKEPAQVALGTGTAPAAWDEFLVGVRRGSRLVILGSDGDGMIAWVVDVLGVS